MSARYMMATVAHHNIGDISRDEPDLCIVFEENDEAYIGRWIEGFGFDRARFPKATTRELTADEREHYNRLRVAVGQQPLSDIRIGPAGEAQ